MGNQASHEDDTDSAGAGKTPGKFAADEAASVIAGAGLTARVHLSLSCDGLANVDFGSKSDPFAVVFMKTPDDTHWNEIGRTEVVANNLNPRFVKLIAATFRFEEVQMLRFDVYDVEGSFGTSNASRLRLDAQSLGSAQCALASIMGAHGQTVKQQLDCPSLPTQRATITIRAEQAKNSSSLVVFELGATGCSNNSVFYRISRTAEAGPPIPCFKSEVTKGSGGVLRWEKTEIGLPVLANGDPHRPLLIELYGYKNFFDYLTGGLEMQFTVAIDYTASNGDPNTHSSLHFHDPTGTSLNQYAQAISGVGSILEYYDEDKRFPVLGFGGCPLPGSPALHCFAVNGHEDDPEVHGIESVLDVYKDSLRWVQLSGPTLFAPVINQAAALAASQRTLDPRHQTYHVLMIVTDGVINDMGNTKDALVAAADLPFSVIIVGVGNADFAFMEELDGDEIRIENAHGKKASRDIVQFVPMRDFANRGFHALAREVLAEVPIQVVEYMKNNRIEACPPRRSLPQVPPRSHMSNSGSRYSGERRSGVQGSAPEMPSGQ